ncbi:hypothetical protein EIN_095950 [Entamoeba invadens IP1]|uniref:HTH myb-type domain-containing protein n=1 Tax=Entamoeba invadens IP1 TaxID=370355 RepID=A0A0A1U3M9_ENTIV|nr:hypothetical protein EIN_095950 [Entamoeba invadens IP1]ELP87338.1 hypothetical protein EIN_095950 [Entamoeba invadens IP1]|eukprot:XP_004254109.1 hypothetical protein EIN_095950 [Entamoeba invadens IP1]
MSAFLRYFNLPEPTDPEFVTIATDLYLYLKNSLSRVDYQQKQNESVHQTISKNSELIETSYETQRNQISDSFEQKNDKNEQKRYWTEKEKIAFEKIVRYFNYTSSKGLNNCLISAFVETRTPAQVRSHAQKFFMRKTQILTAPTEEDVQKIQFLLKTLKSTKGTPMPIKSSI